MVRIAKNELHGAVQYHIRPGIINNIHTESNNWIAFNRSIHDVNNCNDVGNVYNLVTINVTIGILRFANDNIDDFFDVGIVHFAVTSHITF